MLNVCICLERLLLLRKLGTSELPRYLCPLAIDIHIFSLVYQILSSLILLPLSLFNVFTPTRRRGRRTRCNRSNPAQRHCKSYPTSRFRSPPLHKAILRGRDEIITSLLQHDIRDRADEMGTNALHLAALKGDPRILEIMIQYRKQREYDIFIRAAAKTAPIHFAAMSRSLECVQVLVRKGANIHDVTTHAETLLHFAAGKKSVWVKEQSEEDETALLKHLIAAGADVNALASLGISPLWYAVRADNLPAVRELLAASADIQLRNIYEETVLHEAAYHSSLSVVQVLVQAGVDVHARSKTNGSILHRAAEAGRVDTVQWILDHSHLTVNSIGSHG